MLSNDNHLFILIEIEIQYFMIIAKSVVIITTFRGCKCNKVLTSLNFNLNNIDSLHLIFISFPYSVF